MRLSIQGASTLQEFTRAINRGFRLAGVELTNSENAEFALIQIHGAPAARLEDEKIIDSLRELKIPFVFLIHRPDEILLNEKIKSYFQFYPVSKFIFLGDLIYRDPFWENRRKNSKVIPHPFLDLSLPAQTTKPIVGAYTSWGEMRDLKHFLSLAKCLRHLGDFHFQVGGTGMQDFELPDYVDRVTSHFVPHFNVQLYHLHGKKRFGESSGSLHRGVSIPVIFEANGAERLEGFKAIKIRANDDLTRIDFADAAERIRQMVDSDMDSSLLENHKIASKNTVRDFAINAFRFFNGS